MSVKRSLGAALATLMLAVLPATAQDDDLDRLLRGLEEGGAPAAEPTDDESKPGDPKAPDPGGLDESSSDLDRLLEGMVGPRTDRPNAEGAAPEDAPDAPGALEDEAKDTLDGDDQVFDDYLRRLLGRIDPDKQEGNPEGQSGAEGGPLADTMKKMREVEKRLSELDTGETTRERQEQIIRDFDQLLQQIRQQQQQQQQQQQPTKMAGQQQPQPGQNPSGESNGQENGSPPRTPEQNPAMVNAKDSWGHLQDSLREVMGNVSRMMPLEQKRDLIERYFTSVAKRSVDR